MGFNAGVGRLALTGNLHQQISDFVENRQAEVVVQMAGVVKGEGDKRLTRRRIPSRNLTNTKGTTDVEKWHQVEASCLFLDQ